MCPVKAELDASVLSLGFYFEVGGSILKVGVFF